MISALDQRCISRILSPRFGAWWRRPRVAVTSLLAALPVWAVSDGHLKYKAATGHLMYGSTGHLVNDCVSFDSSCSNCNAGTSPLSVNIACAGVSLASCCQPAGSGDWVTVNGPLGTFTVAGTACDYIANSPAVTQTFWTDSSCGSAGFTGDHIKIRYDIGSRILGKDTLTIQSYDGGIYLFIGTLTTNHDCSATRTFTNEITSCGLNSTSFSSATVSGGWSGTATVTPA